jgi:hypothetical protein
LNISSEIIRVIKSTKVKRAGHVARMGWMRNTYNILVGKPEWKRPCGRYGLDSLDSGWGPVAGPCEDSNELSDSMGGGEFLD